MSTWVFVSKIKDEDLQKNEQCSPLEKNNTLTQLRLIAKIQLQELCKQFGVNPYLTIKKTQRGRPYFKDCQLDFNISHSGNFVAVAVTFNGKVGIDIEDSSKKRNIAKIAKHFIACDQNITEQEFYLHFCLREAVLKASGFGISKIKNVVLENKQIKSQFVENGSLYFGSLSGVFLALFCKGDDIQIFNFDYKTKQKTAITLENKQQFQVIKTE
ncbi:MAG: hypothetical protein CR960_00340 [Pasteurellales bacterium]|nr:MAG: hypothetical protein CR960_00340 [Pasteurellales bacterium]